MFPAYLLPLWVGCSRQVAITKTSKRFRTLVVFYVWNQAMPIPNPLY